MRTNIEIDDALIKSVMKTSGSRTKKEAVDAALRLMQKIHSQGSVRRLRGKVHWEGNLEESRLGKHLG